MAFEGVHYALTQNQRQALLSQQDDESRRQYIHERLAGELPSEFRAATEQAWDAIHRCLTGQPAKLGNLDPRAGSPPLNLCIMGGRDFHDGDEYVIRLIETHEVREVAKALAPLDEMKLGELYRHHCRGAFDGYGDEDCDYTWRHFATMKQLFAYAAETGRAVIFTAEQ